MTTFHEIIRSFDEKRKSYVNELGERPSETLTEEEKEVLSVAPVSQNWMFLLPMSEPFFEDIYPALLEIPGTKQQPSIHIGIAGTRNLSIMAAAKADAGILFDFNLRQQELMEYVCKTAQELIEERRNSGQDIGGITPQDFVTAFDENAKAKELLSRNERKVASTFQPELHEPTSWLYEKQTDGRFQHIMRLFAEDKIATLAMNVLDRKGFEDLNDVLENARHQVDGLQNATLGTAFLSNLPYILEKELNFGPQGAAPSKGLFPTLENMALLGNPYLVYAKERVYDWRHTIKDADWRGHMSQSLGRDNINAPTEGQIRRYKSQHSGEFRNMTLGGYLDTVTSLCHAQHDKDEKRKARSTPVYANFTERLGQEVDRKKVMAL